MKKYVLRNIKTKKYFKGYQAKSETYFNCSIFRHGNKPTWTNQIAQALQCEITIAEHTRRRLFCQSQFVELIPVEKTLTEKAWENGI